MIGTRVICINATGTSHNGKTREELYMRPIVEGRTYTVRAVEMFEDRPGYLLEEVSNRHVPVSKNGVIIPGKEPGYATHRFVPLSDIDEEMIHAEEKEMHAC